MSLYTLSFLRTASLPSENASKKATQAKKDSPGTYWPSAAALRHMLERVKYRPFY
jgi:hypothetical protein